MKINSRKKVIITLAISISLLSTGCSSIFPVEEKPMKPPLVQPSEVKYSTVTVEKGNIELTYSSTCYPIGKSATNLKFENSGKLSYLNNQMGLEVKKGDVIAEISAESAKYDLELANIDLKRLMERQTQLLEKTDDTLKYDTLIAKIAVEEKNLTYHELKERLNPYDKDDILKLETAKLYSEKAQNDYVKLLNKAAAENPDLQQLRTDIQKQTLVVKKLEKSVEDSKLRSPISGVIVDSEQFKYKIGDVIFPNDSVATVYDTSSLMLVTNEESKEIRENLKVTVDINGKKHIATLKSRTSTLSNTGDADKSKGYNLFFDKPAPQIKYGDKYQFTCTIDKKENVLLIPLTCVQQLKDKDAFVSILDGKVKCDIPIQVGLKNKTYIEVVSGLKEGDKIVYVK